MYRSDLILKCLRKKRFTICSFSKNINDSIHQFLKNAVCIRPLMLIIAAIASRVCSTVLSKYFLRKYVTTFKARSQTSVNKHNPTCGISYCALCVIPIATHMTKKTLLGKRYDAPLFIY